MRFCLCLLLLFARVTFADEPPKHIVALSRASHDQREKIIEGDSPLADKLRNPLEPYVIPLDVSKLKVGSGGLLDKNRCKVFQVLDESNMLAELVWHKTKRIVQGTGERGSTRILNIPELQLEMLWFSNYDTSKAVEGQEIKLSGCFYVTGTKRYTTPAGSNTVLVIERIELEPYRDLFTRASDARKWTIIKGDNTEHLKAVYAGYSRRRAALYDMDGKLHRVRIDLLSEEDQQVVRDLRGLD